MLFRTLLPLIALASCAGGPENLFVPVSAIAPGASAAQAIATALAFRVLNAGRGTAPGAGSVNLSPEFGDLLAAAVRFKPRTFGVFLSHAALYLTVHPKVAGG